MQKPEYLEYLDEIKKILIENGEICEGFEILEKPQKAIEVSIPVKMDDETLKVFTAYRVQYSNGG
jgi:glutamate dehydrogenase/leucine dehydrogenase